MSRQRILASAVVLGLLAGASQARATVLEPGTTVYYIDQVANPLSDPSAAVIKQTSGSFNASNIDSGTYVEQVVKESSGTLDYLFKFSNNISSATGIERLSAYNFTGASANVGFVAGSGDRPPTSVDRQSDGSVISFNFASSNAVAPGQSSDWLVIKTNATTVESGVFSFQGGPAATVSGFGTAPAVPEPSALALTGIGALGLLGYARRRASVA